jgi:dTDP-4-amino-4,6-dideoxygalactose transaminase
MTAIDSTRSTRATDGNGRRTRSEGPWAIPLSDVIVDDEIAAAVDEVLRSGWWSMGPKVAAFERAFADFSGASHALAVSNGTAALHLALLAVGCGPGDEVILPSLNFVAAANSIVNTGATPVFCDVEGPQDLNMSPESVAEAITPATKAIVVLHYGGHPCRMDALLELADQHGLVLIEDAAHAPGSRWEGRMCGTIGRVGCFSFFSNKNMPVGEGGMVVTSDPELAERLRLLRSHGMTTLTWDRHRGHASTYDVVTAGFNYRLDELRAAIGLVQLERLEDGNRARARIVSLYRAALDGVQELAMPFADADSSCAHHLAVVLAPPGSDRDGLRRTLAEAGVQTSLHYPPIHQFSEYGGRSTRPLPETERVARRLVTLPLYPHLDDAAVRHVTDAVLNATPTMQGGHRGAE